MTHTLMRFSTIAVIAPMVALAQIPPVPPTPPLPPVAPVPPLPPLPPLPRKVFVEPKFDLKYDFKYEFDIAPKLEEMQWHLKDLGFDREFAMDQAREQVQRSREMAQHEMEMAREAAQQARVQVQQQQFEMQRLQTDLLKSNTNFNSNYNYNYSGGDKLLEGKPRAPWAREDPADSLYRLARESLNRGEYRRAANVFNELTKKYPKSQYALDAQYWEAFARYRSGTTDDLREALKILEEGKEKFAYLRQNESNMDVQALRARVQGALAARGDRAAASALQAEAAQQSKSCDREDVSVRAEALSALGQMDPATAMPVVKKVLARRDECTVELRRRALYIIGRQPTADAIDILLDVAKNETDAGIRSEAMSWLSRVGGDKAIPMLEDILRTSQDERTQRSAVNALGTIDTERSRRAIRTIVERPDALERVRSEAILSLAREKDGRAVSSEDIQYLQTLYAKLESARLKETVLSAVSRIDAPETEAFLLKIARSESEPSALRASALQRLGRMQTVSLVEIGKLYEASDSRSMRQQILQALSLRKEPEAIDKLVEIAKKDTDYDIRRYAIQILVRNNSPKALQGIKELASMEKP